MPENAYQITEEDTNLAFPDLASKLGFEASVLSGINSGMGAVPPKGAMILTGPQFPNVGPQFPQPGPGYNNLTNLPAGNFGNLKKILNAPSTGMPAGPRPKPSTVGAAYKKPTTYTGQAQYDARRGENPQGMKQARISTAQAANEQLRQKNNFNAQLNFAARSAMNANDAFEKNFQETGIEDYSMLPDMIGIDVANKNGWTPEIMAKRGFWFDETKGAYINPGGKKDAAGNWVESPTNTQEHVPGTLFANQFKSRGRIYEYSAGAARNVQVWKRKAGGKWRLEMGNWGGQDDRREANRANRRRAYKPTDNGSPVTVLNLKLGSG